MKTLDDVIEALNNCADVNANFEACERCEYRDIRDDGYECGRLQMMEDALHYLKEHKNQQDFYDQSIKRTTEMIDKCEKTVAEYLSVNNPPLTWDELMTMVGKPVFVEVLDDNGDHYKWCGDRWYIVKDFTQGYYGGYCHLEPNWRTWTEQTYGDLWRAYRKERS